MTGMPAASPSPKRGIRILADDRERTARVVEVLQAMTGVEVIRQRLKVGDYQINECRTSSSSRALENGSPEASAGCWKRTNPARSVVNPGQPKYFM